MSIAKSDVHLASAAPANESSKTPSWRLFWIGLLLAIAVIALFAVQVAGAKLLLTPWYLPIGGTLAALLVFASSRPRLWLRAGVGLVCLALACLEWYFLLGLTVLPQYAGPVGVGSGMPTFTAELADGTAFDASYFSKQKMTAIVFFQGRWCPFCMTQLQELESHAAEFERAGAKVVVVSIEDLKDAAQTQRDFPHLAAVSDQRRELSEAIHLINKGFAPDGGDAATPTILLVDSNSIVQWIHRPKRFIARPSAAEMVAEIERQRVE